MQSTKLHHLFVQSRGHTMPSTKVVFKHLLAPASSLQKSMSPKQGLLLFHVWNSYRPLVFKALLSHPMQYKLPSRLGTIIFYKECIILYQSSSCIILICNLLESFINKWTICWCKYLKKYVPIVAPKRQLPVETGRKIAIDHGCTQL